MGLKSKIHIISLAVVGTTLLAPNAYGDGSCSPNCSWYAVWCTVCPPPPPPPPAPPSCATDPNGCNSSNMPTQPPGNFSSPQANPILQGDPSDGLTPQAPIQVAPTTITVTAPMPPPIETVSAPINTTLDQIPLQELPAAPTNNIPADACKPGQTVIPIAGGATWDCSGTPTAQSSPPANQNSQANDNGAEDCPNAYQAAQVSCGNNSPAAQQALNNQMALSPLAANGGVNGACAAMQMQSLQMMKGAQGMNSACAPSIQDCLANCNDTTDASDMKMKAQCQTMQAQNSGGYQNTLAQSLSGLLTAEQCQQMTAAQMSGQCTGGNATTFTCNPGGFCATYPGATQCQAINTVCGGAGGAGNPLCAQMQAAQNGANANLGISSSGDGLGGGGAGGGGGGGGLNPSQLGNHAQAASSDGGSAGGGGGGGMGGGGGGSAAGDPGTNLKAGGKAPDSGNSFGVGSGAGGAGAAAMAEEGGGGGGGSAAGEADHNPFEDLLKFLPGHKEAERELASENFMLKNGITGAGDLSNFDKITRVMNLKRPYMVP